MEENFNEYKKLLKAIKMEISKNKSKSVIMTNEESKHKLKIN